MTVSPPLLLIVDSGNTHVRWGLHDGSKWLKQGMAAQTGKASLEREWQDLREPARILVSHVAGTDAKADLSELFSRWRIEPQWVTAVAYQCGVRNYYADPAQLGSDRWAALVAAWELQRQGCLVVDAGTAMTVDALSDTGEFLGGIITPGIDMMQRVLVEHTASLKPEEGKFCDYPDSTADAIFSGAVHALAGAVERMAALLATTLGHVPDCILCGGAAQQLQSQLNLNVRVMDDLVLEGLILIARESMEDAATGAIKLDP
ncbi:type III pantothenate kinase [Nitrosospira sp. Nsp13]|uniref:type III pantothenate kinase n=1 Tax=Nitrosospira sp. Nsp13 TaxID=1855332 RepID=UPI000883D983|nr:type III pantothenate kinase [Nitrosospira sp. Nsp13]SCX97736.1 type III pantothenate kinase [Nitrosospira sp. Nsp13]